MNESRITPSELAEIKALCEKATPPPWTDANHPDTLTRINIGGKMHVLDFRWIPADDVDFAYASRTLIPRLLAEVEAQDAEIEALRREKEAAISDCTGYCSSCAHVKDCALHDHNDSGPSTWMYGECDEWEWRGPAAGRRKA